jgi:predicted lipoprotein with Yx(FWY)xxD motif
MAGRGKTWKFAGRFFNRAPADCVLQRGNDDRAASSLLEGQVKPVKRKLMVGSAALAVAFALVGCAPAGYNPADYGGGAAQPAANNETAPKTGAGEQPADGQGASGDDERTPQLSAGVTTDSLTAAKVKKMGDTVQNEKGFVLYRFDGDTAGSKPVSTCSGDCAKIWLPALTNDGKPKLAGIDRKLVGTVTRADGTKQLTLKGWPLYRYIGDKAPGTWKGQNVAGKWFVIKSDGTKNLTCLPAISKPVAPPKSDNGSDGAGSDDSGSDYSY